MFPQSQVTYFSIWNDLFPSVDNSITAINPIELNSSSVLERYICTMIYEEMKTTSF